VQDIKKIGEKLKKAFSTSLLQQTAEAIGSELHGDQARYIAAGDCAGTDFKIVIELFGTATFPGYGDGITLSYMYVIGCKKNKFFLDLVFAIGGDLFLAGWNVNPPAKIETGGGIALAFEIATPSDDIVSWAGAFKIVGSATVGGATGTLEIGFKMLPSPDYPKGFKVAPVLEAGSLLGQQARQQEIDDAVEKAETIEDKVYSASGTLLKHFRNIDVTELVQTAEFMSAMRRGAASMKGQGQAEGWPYPKEAALFAGLSAEFCLTCGLNAIAKSRAGANEAAAKKDLPNAKALVNLGGSGCTSTSKCGQCEGDCDYDHDCNAGYKCFQRNGYNKNKVPGCDVGGSGDLGGWDYCIADTTLKNLGGSGCTESKPCAVCQGDCDTDFDCTPGLKCFQRNGHEKVPGCKTGGSGDASGWDFCYKEEKVTSTAHWNDCNSIICGQCQGDCDTDANCAEGLKCFQRNGGESIPGCKGSAHAGWDYCY